MKDFNNKIEIVNKICRIITIIFIIGSFLFIIYSIIHLTNYFNNTNDESNQTEMSMSLESSDITIGKIIDMKDYVHSQYHDTQEIYLITIQNENKTRVVRVTSVTYQKYKIGDTFDITNHIES